MRNGYPELIPDANGDRIVPSVVQLTLDEQIVVGSVAKQSAVTYKDRTVLEVKRLMGQDTTVALGTVSFRPSEISAMILNHLKRSVECAEGIGSVRDVVISVPARFDNPAREATKRAAELAGLNVLRLIHEPTAAALSYGLDRLDQEERVLVFDFGGGTLDVSILEMYEGVLDVKTSVGDDKLGGADIDELLIHHLTTQLLAQKGIELPEDDIRAHALLKEAAEECKKKLTEEQEAAIDLPYLTAKGGLSLTMTRPELDELMQPLLVRALKVVEEAMERAQLGYEEIDVILPIGGSSRIPLFRLALEERWGKPLNDYENPDEAVARGAAIAAGIAQKAFDDNGIMMMDVTPHRLGVAITRKIAENQFIEDYFSEIIAKDAKLPAVQSHLYCTLHDGQESIKVSIFEAVQEGDLCAEHRLIGEMEMENIPKATAGQPIQVDFRYTMDGTLDASAKCLFAPEIKIDRQFSVVGRAAPDEIEESRTSLERLWRDSEQADRCAPLLEQADRMREEKPQHAARIERAMDGLREAVLRGDEAEIERGLDVLTDVLFELS